jgi:hypothetical protein
MINDASADSALSHTTGQAKLGRSRQRLIGTDQMRLDVIE